MKFDIWDKKNNCLLISNCGRFLLAQDGKLWFKEELPMSDGQLEEVFDYEIVWKN